jgi:sensor histidine kinase regulating citrate/malate metabolism
MSHYGTEMIQMRNAINNSIEAFAKENWVKLEKEYATTEQTTPLSDNGVWIEAQYEKYWNDKGRA